MNINLITACADLVAITAAISALGFGSAPLGRSASEGATLTSENLNCGFCFAAVSYLGIAALRLAGERRYDLGLMAFALLNAFLISPAAATLTARLRKLNSSGMRPTHPGAAMAY